MCKGFHTEFPCCQSSTILCILVNEDFIVSFQHFINRMTRQKQSIRPAALPLFAPGGFANRTCYPCRVHSAPMRSRRDARQCVCRSLTQCRCQDIRRAYAGDGRFQKSAVGASVVYRCPDRGRRASSPHPRPPHRLRFEEVESHSI